MSALENQVGGDHYKKLKIQPAEYIHANGIGFMEGSVIKYVTRWRDKAGLQDLRKARHFLDLLIEFEEKAAADEPKADEPPNWETAPVWAEWLTQDADGQWHWFETAPDPCDGAYWASSYPGKNVFAGQSAPNPNWRNTLQGRPAHARG